MEHDTPKANGMSWKTVATIITVAAVGLLVYSSVTGGRHSVSPEQVAKNPDAFVGKPIKIEGKVVKESWSVGRNDNFDHRFQIVGEGGKTFSVHFHGAMPDPFAEDRQVIITGKLEKSRVIKANRILVKCPSRYEDKKYDQHEMVNYKNKLRQNKVARRQH